MRSALAAFPTVVTRTHRQTKDIVVVQPVHVDPATLWNNPRPRSPSLGPRIECTALLVLAWPEPHGHGTQLFCLLLDNRIALHPRAAPASQCRASAVHSIPRPGLEDRAAWLFHKVAGFTMHRPHDDEVLGLAVERV